MRVQELQLIFIAEVATQILRILFDHISKHLEVHQKYIAARCILDSLLGVWNFGQTRSFVFDILLPRQDFES